MPFDAQGNWVDAPTDFFGMQPTPVWQDQPGGAMDMWGSMSGGAGDSTIFGGTAGNPFGTGPSFNPTGWGQIGTGLQDIWGSLTTGGPGGPGGGGVIGTGLRTAPGLLALDYANRQPGFDPTNLQGILEQLGGSTDAMVRAATDPLRQSQAAGYGDLVQSQGLRGIRGSSFGDTDIGNFMDITGRGIANAGANAARGSLAMQGDLATQIALLTQQQQQLKNQMFGRAFDVLGRGLNPQGYSPTINLSQVSGGGSSGGGGGGGGGFLSGLGNVVGGIGSILGMFG